MSTVETLQEWFVKQGIGNLWSDDVAEKEEILLLLASEKQWDDIAEICLNDLKIPKIKSAYLKAYLIKRTKQINNTHTDDIQNDDNKQHEIISNKQNLKKNKKIISAKHTNKNDKTSQNKNNRNNKNKKRNNKTKKDNKKNNKSKQKLTSNTNKKSSNDGSIEITMNDTQNINNNNNKTDKHRDDDDVDINNDIELNYIELQDIADPEYKTFYKENGFKYKQIPTINISSDNNEDNSDYMKYFENQKCCILKGSGLLKEVTNKWSPQYLAKKAGNNLFDVKVSNSRDFRQYNLDKNFGGHTFEAPNKLIQITMIQFINHVIDSRKRLNETFKFSNSSNIISNDDDDDNDDDDKREEEEQYYYYLESSLNRSNELRMDLNENGEWNKCLNIARKCEWGSLMSNDLLIGMKGCLIPLNYQQKETVLIQLRGYSEIILFAPITTPYLYPFPYGHPCYKQSMVNLEFLTENHSFFTNFNASNNILNDNIYRSILSPGDLIYIPCLWWHEIINLNDFTMNIRFCSKYKEYKKTIINKPYIDQILNNKTIEQKIAIGRNIERIVLSKYGSNGNLTTNIFKSFINNDQNYQKYRNDVRKLLKNVFNQQEIDKFVIELINGRYNVDFNQFIKRNCLHQIIKNTKT